MSGSEHQNATTPNITVLPMNYAGDVLMLRDSAKLMLPVGAPAEHENGEDAARRILQAATGFKAEALFALDDHLFLARNLEPTRPMTDPIYQGATERVSLDDIDALFDAGRLRDSAVHDALIAARAAISGDSHADQEGV